MLLEGKTAIVTGGSRGIGEAIVKLFLFEGASVYSLSRSEGKSYNDFKKQAESNSSFFKWLKTDMADRENIKNTLSEILKEPGSIDILVNNAGITKDGFIFRMKDEDWDDVITTNLTSAFELCRGLARTMIKQKSGSIINTSSVVGLMGNAGQVNYSASKAGLIGAVKALAREVGKKNIMVNVVAPGVIETDMTADLPEKEVKKIIPLNRFGVVDDVAATVDFLCSDAQSYIHGQVIGVNGGLAI